jgi:8-oxo-dGTP pyrophosphatase MutT (NUDIX family)
MPHAHFHALLDAYTPSAEELAFKAPMQALLSDYGNCFDNSLIPPGHFTASAWLINADGSQALLTHHAFLNRWLQLGGHADGDPDLLQGALREAHEESGLTRITPLLNNIYDIDIHDIPENPKRGLGAHKHYDVRFLLYTDQTDFVCSDESHALDWFSYTDLMAMNMDASIKRMAHKWHIMQQDGSLALLIEKAKKQLENIN